MDRFAIGSANFDEGDNLCADGEDEMRIDRGHA